jgi:hypothetical protein
VSLKRALSALEQGDHERALGELVAAWRKERAPGVGDAIVALGEVCALSRPAPPGKRAKDVLAAWIARAKGDDPADVSVLLPTLARGRSPDARARLAAVAARDADPRIGRALAALVARPPFQAPSTRPFWKDLFGALPKHADSRCAETLASKRGAMLETLGGAAEMAEWLEKQIDEALASLPEGATCTEPDLLSQVRAAIERTTPSPRDRALRAIEVVDWGKLEDAYGAAHKVKQQLLDIAGADEDACEAALDWAMANLSHQSSLFTASAAAAPVLVLLAGAKEQLHRAQLLWVLVNFAVGDTRLFLAGGGKERDEASSSDEPQDMCWRAVKSGWTTWVRLLGDADASVRTYAAFLSGLVPAAAPDAAPKLRAMATGDADEGAKATALAALGYIGAYEKSHADEALFRAALAVASPLVRGAAAVALALVFGKSTDDATIAPLRDTAADTSVPADPARYPYAGGDVAGHARAIDAALDLKPLDRLFVDAKRELDENPSTNAVRDAFWTVVTRLFNRGPGWHPLPVRLPEDLDEMQREALEVCVQHGIGGLVGCGLFYRPETIARFLGKAPKTALEERVRIGERRVPIWWAFSEAVHERLPLDTCVGALAEASKEALSDAWREIVDGKGAYELGVGRGVTGDVGDGYDRNRLHHERMARVLGAINVLAGDAGRSAAEATAQEQLDLPATWPNGSPRYKAGLACVYSTYALLRHARQRGATLDAKWDPLVAVQIATAPAQRAPAITQEILDALPRERAERIVLDAAPVYRTGRNSHTKDGKTTSWPTIFFDDTLRFLALVKGAATAERVVEAIEAWAAVHDEVPRGEHKPDPLPKEELLSFLVAVGEAARAPLERSLSKNHGAKKVVAEALRRLACYATTPKVCP